MKPTKVDLPDGYRITKQIFMGSGGFAMAEVEHLHAQLDEALSILSGIQQSPMSTDPEGSHDIFMEQVKEGEVRLDDIAKEIFVALTGGEVEVEVVEGEMLRKYPEMPDGWIQGVDSKNRTQWTKKGHKWGVTRYGDEEFALTYLSESGVQFTRNGKEAILPTPAIAAGIADTLDFEFEEASYVGMEESSGTIPYVICTDLGLGMRDDQKAFMVADDVYVTYLPPDYGIKAGDELLLPISIIQYPLPAGDPVLVEIPTSEKDGPTREYVPASSIRWVLTDPKFGD
jgi:hypothetical protein